MAWQTPKTNWTSADGVQDLDLNRIESNVTELKSTTDAFVTFSAESDLAQYKKDVTVIDANGNPTEVTYKRKTDNTLAIKRNASNPDTNGYYQTLVERFYNTDGTTVHKTVTYTFTFLENGIIDTSDGGVVS